MKGDVKRVRMMIGVSDRYRNLSRSHEARCVSSLSPFVLMVTSFLALGPLPSSAQDSQPGIREDVVYGHKDGMALTMDVIEPQRNRRGIGLMFMVSGGWVSMWAPPQQMQPLFQPFTDAGYTVIAIRHGSSPKYLIPEIVDDVRLALAHVHKNAEQWDIDPSRLGVFGYSAGGHLSLMLGTTANDAKEKKGGRTPRIAAVAAVFPPTDLEPYTQPDNPLREQFPALKFDRQRSQEFSPLRQVSPVDAPTLLIHGDKDELVPLWHSEKIRDAMTDAKVPNRLVVMEGAGHGFDAKGNQAMFQAMVAWFDEHLAEDQKKEDAGQ
jgi:acetyl esterase/lipase